MSTPDLVDAATVRKFLELLHGCAASALSGLRPPGLLHLVSMAPDDRGMSLSPFNIGDVDQMLEAALADARAGRNVYVETRTVRPGRPNERGKLEATIAVFALVIDCDVDKGRGGHVNGDAASAIIETSPGNSHQWLFLERAIGAAEAQALGIMIRKATGADHCTGVVTQPYRVAGTANYPDSKKIARGRITVPTRLVSITGKTWTPDELIAAFTTDRATKVAGTLNRDVPHRGTSRRKAIAKAKIAAKVDSQTDRSAAFQSAVNAAAAAGMTPDQIELEMREHPDGPQQKYLEDGDRLRQEIDRSFEKVEQQQQQRAEEHAQRVEAGKEIDGAALLDEVYAFLRRFVVYPNQHACVAHTLWIAHTHLMSVWDTTPRLAFLSPEPASGKTRALEVTELLVPQPVPAINVSAAFLIRTVAADAGSTILFDEADATFGPKAKDSNEDVRALINAGYRRGATVGRCVVYGATVTPELLPAFAPVALAGLGDLPDTILSRSIIIRMRRRAPNESVEPYRRREVAPEGEAMCGRLVAWAAATMGRLVTAPEMPPEIVDRDADCWEPLISVADAAGGHWPDTARCNAVTLVMLNREEREESLGIRLLSDMRVVLGDDEGKFTSNILDALCKLDESPWNDIRGKQLTDRGLAVRLRGYGIKPKPVRIGANVARGYRREDFIEAWRRYLPPLSS
jgi:hypothetical protein